jgi:hypothetical protein
VCLDRFGGAQHAVTVPIDLDEPFEILTPQRYRGASIETSAEAETETERAGSLPVRPVTLDVPRTGRETEGESEGTEEHVQIQLPLSPGSTPLDI